MFGGGPFSHRPDSASTSPEDALQASLLGVGAFRGSTHRVTRGTHRVHTARRCPVGSSVGGWGVHTPRHIASHRSDFASTRPEDALQAPLLGVGAFRGSTHRVTSLRFRVHTARGCPGVRSVGGRRVQGLHTSRHTRHILRPIAPICALYCRGIASAPVTAPFVR